MCYEYVDKNYAGVSSKAREAENSPHHGQCSICWVNIPERHPCGILEGKLVCYSRVKIYNSTHDRPLTTYRYGVEVWKKLKKYNNKFLIDWKFWHNWHTVRVSQAEFKKMLSWGVQ